MRVLITGNLGYVGSVLSEKLVREGYDVRGLDSNLYRDTAIAESFSPPTTYKDIRDVEIVDLDNADVVVHLAALSNDPLGMLDPVTTFAINRDATVRLAELARRTGVGRFIFASTCSVYGAAGTDLVDEHSPTRPVTPYAASKLEAEHLVLPLAHEGFDVIVLRPGTAYGYSPCMRFDLVVNNLIAWVLATGSIMLKGDGTAWRPLIHVDDFASSIAALVRLGRGRTQHRVFNLGSDGEVMTVRSIAETLTSLWPGTSVVMAADAIADARSYRVAFKRWRACLASFRSEWTLTRGAADLLERLAPLALTPEDFEGQRFSRVERTRYLQAIGALDDALRWTDDVAGTPIAAPEMSIDPSLRT